MQEIKLLDCTLRDGGFVNDWNFGKNSILTIFSRLNNANIDIIEIGFLDGRVETNFDRTINPKTSDFDKLFSGVKNKKAFVAAMVDYGTCDIDNIKPSPFIDGIRVIFKKKDMDNALSFCKQIKDKGFKVFVQPVSITSYSDKEMLGLVEKVNKLYPFSMAIVDTYGLMHKDNMIKYFHLIDENLNKDITVGYHSHNNFQLAYSNSIELLGINTGRSITIDGSLYGMGKGAGNANTELLAMRMNDNFGKNYDIDELLEAIDVEIVKLTKKFSWGYSLSHFLAASNDCHPDYVKYLRGKNTLSVKCINNILNSIEEAKKLTFDKKYIDDLYLEYQKQTIDDTKEYNKLKSELAAKNILLLGPGHSIVKQKDKILDYIEKYKPVIFSVNYVPDMYKPDYVFVSNEKRYGRYMSTLTDNDNSFKIIATSNLTPINNEFDFILNYGKLLNSNDLIKTDSLGMLLNALRNLAVKNVSLAGFDGFSTNDENYFDTYMEFAESNIDEALLNEAISKQLAEFKKIINLKFVTDTLYQ